MTSWWLAFLFPANQTQALLTLFRASLHPPRLPAPGSARRCSRPRLASGMERKKTGVAECPEAFDHAGLLVDGPPGTAGLPFL